MEIKQFEDRNLAHYSYAIIDNDEMALIDPSRNPQPYYEFAEKHNARITAVIETHPHADFISSHLEIYKTKGATIYASKLVGALYPHKTFDEGDVISLNQVTLQALNTPGHSPDSICISVVDENSKEQAVFTGDTLFIGDCGRPDLRESTGTLTTQRKHLARQMYYSLRDKLMLLPDNVIVYPAHGAGSLCGKGLSSQNSSTMGAEKISNWCLQKMTEENFVKQLLSDQPFVPKYFPFDVELNKHGADNFEESVLKVKRGNIINSHTDVNSLDPEITIIDTRPQAKFKHGHLKNAINLMNDTKFETWLGSIIYPEEKFYLLAESENILDELIARTAKIGYEKQIEKAYVSNFGDVETEILNLEQFKSKMDDYTIVDIRNDSEVKSKKVFSNSIHIPLHQLRERLDEIPDKKPVVVHCAGGFRSAAGSSIIESKVKTKVFDLSEAIKSFQ